MIAPPDNKESHAVHEKDRKEEDRAEEEVSKK